MNRATKEIVLWFPDVGTFDAHLYLSWNCNLFFRLGLSSTNQEKIYNFEV